MKKNTKLIKHLMSFFKENRGTCLLILIILLMGTSAISFPFIEKNFSCLAEYYFGGEKSPKGELLKIILQIIGGIFLVVGAWATYRRVQIMEQNSIADKLRNAIEQLDSNKTSIVVGSLHALNYIAKTNNEYVQQIVGIFESHIRDRMDKEKDWKSLTWEGKKKYRLPTEVQTILDILFRNKDRTIYQNGIIDLSRCKLHCANLSYANLQNAYLNSTELQGANLSYSNVSNIDMEGANLSFARLIGTKLLKSKISGAYFIGATLSGTNFQFAKLRNARFEHAHISSVHFERAILRRASFIGCNLIDTNYSCAELAFANFSGSRLLRSNFSFSGLSEVKFDGCLIKDADMRQAELYATQFYGACSKLKSGRDETEYNFHVTINERKEKLTDFDKSILMGEADVEMISRIKTEAKKEINDKMLLAKYLKCVDNSTYTGFDFISKGTLSAERVEKAIGEYKGAFQFVGVTHH